MLKRVCVLKLGCAREVKNIMVVYALRGDEKDAGQGQDGWFGDRLDDETSVRSLDQTEKAK